MYIAKPDELAQWCEQAHTSKILAVDTEFLRERTFYPKLCLVQLATADATALVDPLALSREEMAPLAELLVSDSITKVFHSCGQDLEVLDHALGVIPTPVFDTQVASEFLGFRMQVGYGALVEAYTDVHLRKAESLSDWSRRPLTSEQLSYAEEDVLYLPGIYDTMVTQLIEKDRLGWLAPEMEALTDPARLHRDPKDAYRHLKRSSNLTRHQLAVAREVAAWREEAAAKRDIPRKWCISDETVSEISRRSPKTIDQLRRIRGTEQISDRDCRAILAAVARGLECPTENLPETKRHARPSADTESVVDLMYAMLRVISERTGLATQLIATRDDLTALAQGKMSTPLLADWRYEVAGRELEALLAGSVGLTVKDGRVEML